MLTSTATLLFRILYLKPDGEKWMAVKETIAAANGVDALMAFNKSLKGDMRGFKGCKLRAVLA